MIALLIAGENEGVPVDALTVLHPDPECRQVNRLLPGERIIGMRTIVCDELCVQGGLSSPAVIEEPRETHDATL